MLDIYENSLILLEQKMGRGKLNMELISNERSRMITYQKRKKGLTKKAREFHILCDVDACVIIFGPKLHNRPVDVETWPTDRSDIRRIINRFRSKGTERKRTQDLSDFFVGRKKKVDDEIAKVRKAYLEAKFPVWDNRLNLLSVDQLRVLGGIFDSKLEEAKSRVLKLRGNQYLMENSKSVIKGGSINNKPILMGSTFANALLHKNIELDLLNNQQPLSCLKQLDMQLPTYYPSDQAFQQQILPFNVSPINSPLTCSPINSPMLMMMMNGEDFSQFGGTCSSKIARSPLKAPVYYNCDQATEMLGNVMFNNPRAHPTNFYGPSRQPMLAYRQGPVRPNVSSQIRIPQLSDFCDVNEFEMNNKGFRHVA